MQQLKLAIQGMGWIGKRDDVDVGRGKWKGYTVLWCFARARGLSPSALCFCRRPVFQSSSVPVSSPAQSLLELRAKLPPVVNEAGLDGANVGQIQSTPCTVVASASASAAPSSTDRLLFGHAARGRINQIIGRCIYPTRYSTIRLRYGCSIKRKK